jgi:acetolactate synthase-1/3 small subunit
MPDPIPNPQAPASVIELLVRNHPGTMSHITGLFSRRGFNLEAIACVPVGGGATSRILLLVPDEPRLEQVERQLERLYDVLELRLRRDLGPGFFAGIAELIRSDPVSAAR